ncbi:MAG: hypothetical protein R3357_04250, partial [Burkholderiales bacterium]|nr:hypothetical protein [Burkholderiales bacterium]
EAQRRAEAEASRARADAELARAREQAEAIKRQAQAQMLAANRAREEAEQSAAKAKALEASTTARTAAAPSAAAAAPSYDGDWIALQSCPATPRAPAVRARWRATISQGAVQVRRGTPGANGYVSLDGRIASDGSLAMQGVLIPARAELGRDERTARYAGRLEGTQFLLSGTIGRRPCTLALSRAGG